MEKIVLYKRKSECCGCGGCENICPQKAISMKTDEYGFLYPDINEKLCIKCEKCINSCNYGKTKKKSLKETYVSQTVNTDIMQSASGGLFASIATMILEQGGEIYGCGLIRDKGKLLPKHIGITKESELYKVQGSKYVQSDLNDVFKRIKKRLIEDKLILFSGTPCQIAGLKGYLQKDYPTLYTIDIICHGVPSVKFFQDYITFEEKKMSIKIIDFKFRDKTQGWKLYGKLTYLNKNNEEKYTYFEPKESSYYQMFLNSYTYRDSCYCCPYAGENRQGNITIGDFWCVDLVHPELIKENNGPLRYQEGTSCLIINDEKGEELIKEYGKGLQLWKSSYENAVKYNGQLKESSKCPKEREIVLKKYKKGYQYVENWYRKKQIPIKIKENLRKRIPSFIKRFVRKFNKRI